MKKYIVELKLEDNYKTENRLIELDNLLSVIGFVIFAKLNKVNSYTITKIKRR